MMKTLLLGAFFACMAIPAFALDVDTAPSKSAAPIATPVPEGQADAPVAHTPDTTTVKAPEGCKFVRVTRPDVNPDKPEIYLTFRGYGGTTDAIEACNSDALIKAGASNVFGVANSPTAGARVSVRTKNGVGVVGLPIILADGSIHQVHCKEPSEGKFPFDFYKTTWHGGLPDSIDLQKADMPEDQGARICEAALPPDLRAKLNLK